jgi:hypothetical protein
VRAWRRGGHQDNFAFLLKDAFVAPPHKPPSPQPLSTAAAR